MSTTPPPSPTVAAELRRLTRTELSMGGRLAYVLLALAASAMTVVVTSLWLTEPMLPTRTVLAFGALACIGLGWVTFSLWVLTSQHVMLVHHRVIAGRLAVLFTGAFVMGCVLLNLTSAIPAARPASAMGTVLLVVAIVLSQRAKAMRSRLLARRDTLERQLQGRTR